MQRLGILDNVALPAGAGDPDEPVEPVSVGTVAPPTDVRATAVFVKSFEDGIYVPVPDEVLATVSADGTVLAANLTDRDFEHLVLVAVEF